MTVTIPVNRESEELNPTNDSANALQDDCDSSHCQQSDTTSVDADAEKLEKEAFTKFNLGDCHMRVACKEKICK